MPVTIYPSKNESNSNKTFKWNFIDSIWTPTEGPTVIFVPTCGALDMDKRKLMVGKGFDAEASSKFPSMTSVAYGSIQSRGESLRMFVPNQGPNHATVSFYSYPPILLYRPYMNFGLGIFQTQVAPGDKADLKMIEENFMKFMKLINYLTTDPSMKLMGENNLPPHTEFRLGLPKTGINAIPIADIMDIMDGVAQNCYINHGMEVFPIVYTKGKNL